MTVKKILLGGLLCVSGLYSVVSQATCRLNTLVNVNFNFPASIIVQRDLPVGGVIFTGSYNYPLPATSSMFVCDTNGNAGRRIYTNGWAANGEGVAATNVSGVGIRIRDAGGAVPGTMSYNAGSIVGRPSDVVAVELIKTGDISPGKLLGGTYMEAQVTGLFTFTRLTNTGSGGNIVPVACSVTNTAINVPMGNVQRSTFSGVGHEGSPVEFSIPLDCNAGTRVNFKIDATADSSGVPGVMALNSSAIGSAASGVGIKLTRSGTPVAFGTTIPAGTSATAGVFNIPLTATYYQTSPDVTAGQANGTATFTMTYN